MSDELFERVLVQLQPELAQEFGHAILEDRKKLKTLESIKEYFILTSEYGKISFELKKEIPEDKYALLKEVLL